MEDYKELIERLEQYKQSWDAYNNHGLCCALESAIDAIEKLIKERNEYKEPDKTTHNCYNCKNYKGNVKCGFHGMTVEIDPNEGCVVWEPPF